MRDLINWSETDEKSRHGLPVLRIRLQKFARAVIGTNNVDCCARV